MTDVNYTPTEADKNMALSVIGWALREEMNRLQANLGGAAVRVGRVRRENTAKTLAMIQCAWERYLERVGRQ